MVAPTGALISAGFEVSATVGTDNDIIEKVIIHKMSNTDEQQILSSSDSQFMLVRKTISHDNLLDPMDDWLNVKKIPQNEL